MRGHLHLLRTLVLLQIGLAALAALGEMITQGGNPAYLVLPAARSVLLLIGLARTAHGRRWGLVAIVILADLSLSGFLLSAVLGLLPWWTATVNLVGLLTNLVLPAALLVLAVWLLRTPPPRPLPRTLLAPPGLPAPPLDWSPPVNVATGPHQVTRILPVGAGR